MLLEQESLAVQKGFQRLEAISLEKIIPSGAQFLTQVGILEISFYAPGVIRLRCEVQPENDYQLLVNPAQQVFVTVQEIPGGYSLSSGKTSLEILSGPLRLRLLEDDRLVLESVTDRGIQGEFRYSALAHGDEGWLFSFALRSAEPIYGLGEKFSALNKRGQLINAWNRDALGVNSEASYKNMPFAWSPEGWGLFLHTTARLITGAGYAPWSHRTYITKLLDPNLDLFLISAQNPAEILEKFTQLTGRAPLPPLWSYGVWMSRAYYRTAEEILEVAEKLREHNLPCDVLTLDGRAWHKMETRFDFSWDPERYPDPAAFIQRLKEQNYQLCLWEYPYLSIRNPLFNELSRKGFFLRTPDGQTYLSRYLPEPFDTLVPHLMPSGIIDFTNPEAYAWYAEMHKALFEIGVQVMKTDYGEAVPEDIVAYNGDSGKRLHNVYALLYNRCVYEASEQAHKQGMVWGRAGWIGSQRYPIQWGGDPQVDWEGLAGSLRGALSWGMSGVPFYAHDIGGFAIGNPHPDLLIRWAQAGIFASHTRFHGIGAREPYAYGKEVENLLRGWLEWRYRMIPYLQICASQANQTGLPVMRAMPLAFPQEPACWGFEEQYMLGNALLVAPVIRPDGQVKLYLPAGAWYDLWSGERLEGPAFIDKQVPLEDIPVYAREGTWLPLGKAVQHTGQIDTGKPVEEIWTFGRLNQEIPGYPEIHHNSKPGELVKHCVI